MKRFRSIRSVPLAWLLAAATVNAAEVMKPVPLPAAKGEIAGAAFSPDSARLAIVRNSPIPGTPGPRYVLQIVELRSGQELAHTDVLKEEPWDTRAHIEYSPDGNRLLLAANGSDVLSIIDTSELRKIREIALHSGIGSRKAMAPSRYPSGVIALARPLSGDLFGALTDDNEVFLGSFSSGQILESWSLGKGRTGSELGQVSLSLSQDGSNVLVPVLPFGNSLPKALRNLRLFASRNGEIVKSVRTSGPIGQVVLLVDNKALATTIDPPGLFPKRACMEKWNLNSESLEGQFCDQGRNVIGPLSSAPDADQVAGFASRPHKDIEGHVYGAPGRVDLWNITSGTLLATSDEFPSFIRLLRVSANGEWLLADQTLLRTIVNGTTHGRGS
jgi:hypothetical protein